MKVVKESHRLALVLMGFLLIYFMPAGSDRFQGAILEGFHMLNDYAREHVLLCLVPAFFIAGAMENFISQGSVMKYLGQGAWLPVAYGVAAVSGTVLAVCSCTVLPLFMGIYKRGAGLGPASAFLYSGPAINVLAIIMTARILGVSVGLARAVAAVLFALLIGLAMAGIFREEEEQRQKSIDTLLDYEDSRTVGQTISFFATLISVLIFAAWARADQSTGIFYTVFRVKWALVAVLLGILAYMVKNWFDREELNDWVMSTWDFAKRVLPLLFGGVFVAGILMGRPGTGAGLLPPEYVARAVGGNSLVSNFVASLVGALMYFATLTEVPIIQGLIGSGMGQGPALALLLAGPALSLPSLVVLGGTLGLKKASVFAFLVVAMATLSGLIFGHVVG